MIDLSPVLSSPLPPATPNTAGPGSATDAPPTSFGQTLGAFLDASDAVSAQTPALAAGARQGIADDGRTLPPAASQDEAGGDPSDTNGGAVPTLFPAFILPAIPGPVATDSTVASDAHTVASPSVTVSTFPATQIAQQMPLQPISPSAPTTSADADHSLAQQSDATLLRPADPPTMNAALRPPAPAAGPSSPIGSRPPGTGPIAAFPTSTPADIASATPMTVPVARQDAPSVATIAPNPEIASRPAVADVSPLARGVAPTPADPAGQAIAVTTVAQPAGQVFAAAIASAASWRARATRSGEREPTDLAAAFTATVPTAISDRAIVQPTGDAQHAALDLTRDTGLQGMIDRIETLRDDADSRDTRVRLTPDALGSVDVAVRQQGDRVHVTFTAEQDATRALIADAQPRLSELAAQRGVRIGDTSVGTGAGGGGASQRSQADPRFVRAPTPAASTTESPITDHRLA